jgi:hypothetical protein
MTSGLDEYVEHFRARVLQDALNEATATYWLRRAEQFAAVGTPLSDEIAQACRNAASLAILQPQEIVCTVCMMPPSPWTCSCGQSRIGEAA